jgi:hypothetical protein
MDKPLHYEIHVTVKTDDVKKFIEECGAIGVKPIVLDLQLQDTSSIQDVMTSSKLSGDDTDVWTRMKEISWYLQSKGFNVVREKIETVPWHPKALLHGEDSKEGYFETHIPVVVKEEGVAFLKGLSQGLGLHCSRNSFKKLHNGNVVQMVTLRKSCTLVEYRSHYDWILSSLYKYGYSLAKESEIEYALHDSNVSHDAAWIGS